MAKPNAICVSCHGGMRQLRSPATLATASPRWTRSAETSTTVPTTERVIAVRQ